jgi:hypothetical protein
LRASITFAGAHDLTYDHAEYSILLTNDRLNFILTRFPETEEFHATAIARSEPSDEEAELFRRFVSSLDAKCVQATE